MIIVQKRNENSVEEHGIDGGKEDKSAIDQSKNEGEDFKENLSKKMKQFCCPIFLKEHSYDIAHSHITPNATMTFIKYNKKVYGCTCKHVVKDAIDKGKNGNPGALHILAGLTIFDFNGILCDPKDTTNSVSYPEFLIPNDGADIAIRPLPLDWFNNFLAPQKELKYFDFDDYQKPDYENIKMLHAFGWLDDHKTIEQDKVLTKLAHSTVELGKPINENSLEIILASQLKEVHNLSFSGMSGGPVVDFENDLDKIFPMGIIYRGSPGKDAPKKNISIFDCRDYMMYKCYNLTPTIFAELLEDSDWNYNLDSEYRNFNSWGQPPQMMFRVG